MRLHHLRRCWSDASVCALAALIVGSGAVLQWEYTPTVINGEAIPVLLTVTVRFTGS